MLLTVVKSVFGLLCGSSARFGLLTLDHIVYAQYESHHLLSWVIEKRCGCLLDLNNETGKSGISVLPI